MWAPRMAQDPRADVTVRSVCRRPAEDARNGCAKDAIEGGYDFLLTIDHDVVPKANPIDLAFMGKDIVGFAVPQWNMTCPEYPLYIVAMDKSGAGYAEHKEKDGLQAVDAVGSGCLMASRKALEAVPAPFMRRWGPDGVSELGLDFNFCERAKEKGIQAYCHYGYMASHMKEVDLLDVLRFKES